MKERTPGQPHRAELPIRPVDGIVAELEPAIVCGAADEPAQADGEIEKKELSKRSASTKPP